jgi:hypothetical protein
MPVIQPGLFNELIAEYQVERIDPATSIIREWRADPEEIPPYLSLPDTLFPTPKPKA